MVKKQEQALKENNAQEKPAFDLKPIQELKGLDFVGSDAMVCDLETGICGPANQKEEKK